MLARRIQKEFRIKLIEWKMQDVLWHQQPFDFEMNDEVSDFSRAYKMLLLPDIIVLLNVDFMELCFPWLSSNVIFHFHRHVTRKHRQQQTFLLRGQTKE